MSKRNKLIFALLLMLALALGLAGCTGDLSPYPGFGENGYTIRVRYDCSGGLFANTNNVTIVDVFNPDKIAAGSDSTKSIRLLEPGSSERGEAGKNLSTPSNTGHFLMGWYRERSPRVSDSGEPLDAYGVPTSQSGRPQGYVFSQPWNFMEDRLTIEPGKEYLPGEDALTLYAAWVPYFTYTFYAPDADSTWKSIGQFAFNPVVESRSLQLPEWNMDTGRMEMYKFPEQSDATFTAAYLDSALERELSADYQHTGSFDAQHGVSLGADVPIYTTWKEGVWFKISTARQFADNGRINGCYEILADLDFTDVTWPAGLSRGEFTGKIVGNNHTFSNVSAVQTDTSDDYGGLFGRIRNGAEITDVTFENVTVSIAGGSRKPESYFGLFAGYIEDEPGALPAPVLKNVKVSGCLKIGKIYPPESAHYSFGLFSGNLVTCGIDFSEITCVADRVQVGMEQWQYPMKVQVDAETGEVKVFTNENPDADPNV